MCLSQFALDFLGISKKITFYGLILNELSTTISYNIMWILALSSMKSQWNLYEYNNCIASWSCYIWNFSWFMVSWQNAYLNTTLNGIKYTVFIHWASDQMHNIKYSDVFNLQDLGKRHISSRIMAYSWKFIIQSYMSWSRRSSVEDYSSEYRSLT